MGAAAGCLSPAGDRAARASPRAPGCRHAAGLRELKGVWGFCATGGRGAWCASLAWLKVAGICQSGV